MRRMRCVLRFNGIMSRVIRMLMIISEIARQSAGDAPRDAFPKLWRWDPLTILLICLLFTTGNFILAPRLIRKWEPIWNICMIFYYFQFYHSEVNVIRSGFIFSFNRIHSQYHVSTAINYFNLFYSYDQLFCSTSILMIRVEPLMIQKLFWLAIVALYLSFPILELTQCTLD